MSGFLTFIVILAGIIWLFRYLRQRELDAFLDEDLSLLDDLIEKNELPKAAREHVAQIAATPGPAVPIDAVAPGPAIKMREAVLDEIHRDFLSILEMVVGERYRIFVQMPLTDFLRADSSSTALYGKTISFLICDRKDFSVAFGIALRGAGQSEMSRFNYLNDVFRQIGKPLLSFPMIQGISDSEVRETLAAVLGDDRQEQHCPKCGQEMVMRKATRGANAGRKFWVCKEFPGCRGILRIGSPI